MLHMFWVSHSPLGGPSRCIACDPGPRGHIIKHLLGCKSLGFISIGHLLHLASMFHNMLILDILRYMITMKYLLKYVVQVALSS